MSRKITMALRGKNPRMKNRIMFRFYNTAVCWYPMETKLSLIGSESAEYSKMLTKSVVGITLKEDMSFIRLKNILQFSGKLTFIKEMRDMSWRVLTVPQSMLRDVDLQIARKELTIQR
jgi:hypothetical protein